VKRSCCKLLRYQHKISASTDYIIYILYIHTICSARLQHLNFLTRASELTSALSILRSMLLKTVGLLERNALRSKISMAEHAFADDD
jgi:hypothetical protein